MHIAHVICSGAFAGVERHVCTLTRGLVDRGARVTVIGGAPGAMRSELAGTAEFIPALTVGDAVRALMAIPRVDVINTHMSEADLAGIRSGFRRRSPRLVSTRHFAARRGSGSVVRGVFGLLAGRIDAQIAISDFVAAQVGEPSTVVRSGVARAEGHTANARDRVVLMAQRLESEKSTASALAAWAQTDARTRGWRLRIAGQGAARADLETTAARLGISDEVDFLGYRTDVAQLMANAGIFLASAENEPLGLSVLEAMARATPVVAAAGGGHLETVGAVAGAALYEPGNVTQAAAAIDRLAADEEERSAYGKELQRHQRLSFNVGDWCDGTLNVYESVVRR